MGAIKLPQCGQHCTSLERRNLSLYQLGILGTVELLKNSIPLSRLNNIVLALFLKFSALCVIVRKLNIVNSIVRVFVCFVGDFTLL